MKCEKKLNRCRGCRHFVCQWAENLFNLSSLCRLHSGLFGFFFYCTQPLTNDPESKPHFSHGLSISYCDRKQILSAQWKFILRDCFSQNTRQIENGKTVNQYQSGIGCRCWFSQTLGRDQSRIFLLTNNPFHMFRPEW